MGKKKFGCREKLVLGTVAAALTELKRSVAVKTPFKASLLHTIDDIYISTEVPTLSLEPEWMKDLELTPEEHVFDPRFCAWYFAASPWEDCEFIGLDDLQEILPPGTISEVAVRAGVWERFFRVFKRTIIRSRRIGDKIITVTSGETEEHITVIDLKKKLFTCSCPAFNSEDENFHKRHLLCKHLLLTIYHNYQHFCTLDERLKWTLSYRKLQETIKNTPLDIALYPNLADEYKTELVGNWIYYFLKHVFAPKKFRAARFANLNKAKKAAHKI